MKRKIKGLLHPGQGWLRGDLGRSVMVKGGRKLLLFVSSKTKKQDQGRPRGGDTLQEKDVPTSHFPTRLTPTQPCKSRVKQKPRTISSERPRGTQAVPDVCQSPLSTDTVLWFSTQCPLPVPIPTIPLLQSGLGIPGHPQLCSRD